MESPMFEFREIDRDRFEEVRSGIKKVETRAGKEKYLSVAVGDVVTFTCGADSFTKKVTKRYHWAGIEEMLAEIPLKDIMPDLDTLEQVKARYASYPDYVDHIPKFGILGFMLG